METVTLENIITEGHEIRKMIQYIPPTGFRTFKVYSISDRPRYEKWKNLVIRFLTASYSGDRCVKDFEEKTESFSKNFNPNIFDDILGLLESCRAIPILPSIQKAPTSKIDKSVHVNVTQTQSQSQEQSFAIDIFLEAIKDEIKGKQLKELKAIAQEEPNPEKAKTKVFDKIKSWGGDVLANVVANIVTNPNIWNGLM